MNCAEMLEPKCHIGGVRLFAAVLCLAACPTMSAGQRESWEEALNAASTADSQGRVAEAEKLYWAAIEKAETFGPTDWRVATGMEHLGMFYFVHQRHSEAETVLRRAYGLDDNLEQTAPDELRRIRSTLAAVLQAEGRDREAEKLYLDAVEKAKGSGKEDVRLADSLEELGRFYEGHREFDDAEPLFKKVLEIKRRILPPGDENLAEPLGELTTLYRSAEKPAEAEPYMLETAEIEERVSGPESSNFVEQLGFLAELYREEGKYPEAESTMRRAMAIDMKLDGPESFSVAGWLGGLGDLATGQENYAEAEQFYKEALSIEEKILPPDHVQLLSTLQSLAELFRREKGYAQAEATYEKVLALQAKSETAGSGSALGTTERLGPLYEEEGKFSEAEALYCNAVRTDLAALPRGDLSTIASLNDLALFLERRDRLAEAETYYQEALDQFDVTGAPADNLTDSNRAIVMKNYARLLRKMNRPSEAAPFEKAARAIDERLSPSR